MIPPLLLMHPADDVRARATAAFAGLPVRLLLAHDTESAARAITSDTRLVLTDVSQARWAAGFLESARTGGASLPALAVFAPFEAEPQAFQAGALALVSHPLAPAEAQALAALATADPGLAVLAEAVASARARGATGHALEKLGRIIATASGPVLAWAQYHAAALLLNEGKLQEALEDLSALVDEQPAFWRAHERLAAVWDVAGDPDAAIRHRGIATEIQRRLAVDSDAALAAHPPQSEAPQPAPPLAAAAAPAAPERPAEADVIIADDSELVRDMLADVLERAGFTVRQASNGNEALDLARARRPDILILDGLMPGKTGFDACKELKDVLYPKNPPKVLIFSAIYTKQRQRSEAVSLYKVDEVLAKPTDKPLDEAELLAAVRRHLPR